MDAGTSPSHGNLRQEEYGLKDSALQRTTMVLRRAERQAAFLLPHLRPGMSLLDCGCGPGTITAGLAERVAPGEVVGIDISETEINRATAHAAERGLKNVVYRIGNVYELPFEDESFDAVYTNALLDHLSDPVGALREMYRVLKRGGVVGARTADRDGYLIYPSYPAIVQALQVGEAEKAAQGVKVRIGKEIRRMLREAGFVRTEASASFDVYGTPELVQNLSRAMIDRFEDAESEAWRQWGESPDAFFAHCLCEGLGWRE